MIEREEFLISEIEFVLDVINQLIEIYASVKDVKKLITVFNQTIENSIKLQPLEIKPFQFLKAFKENADSCEIAKLYIKNFISEKGVIGNYDIKVIEDDLAWKLVEKCRNDVVKATISVDEGSIEGIVQIFQNGKFKIVTKPKNSNHLILSIIKDLISKNIK